MSLKSHRKSYSEESQKILFWWNRSPRTSSTKSSTSFFFFSENSDQRKIVLTENDLEIQRSERKNSEYARSKSQSEFESQGKQLEANQSKLNVKEKNGAANRRWRIIFIKNPIQEVAEKLKNWKDAAIKKEFFFFEKRRLEDIPTQHDHESRSVRLFFFDPDILCSYDDPRSSSSPFCLVFKEAQPRSWNAAKYTRGYDHSWKRFWSSTCLTRSWRVIQLFKKFGNTIENRWCRGFWEKKELRIVGAQNHCNKNLYLAFQ